VVLGMTVFNEYALSGDIFHIFSHAIMKSTLFLAAGAVIWKTGKKKISDLQGVGRQMPITMGAFTLAAFAMIGIPPLNGFLSKWTLCLGFLEGGYTAYVIVLLVSSMLNAMYYLPIILPAFLGGNGATSHHEEDERTGQAEYPVFEVNEVPLRMVIPVAILAACTLLFGTLPTNVPFDLSQYTSNFLLDGFF